MPKKKNKKKRKQRESSNGAWSSGDFEWDRWGRLVPKNPLVTRQLIEAISRDGGLVVHVTPEMSVQVLSDLQNIRCPIPLFGCPNPNKTECPDLICGDRLLKRVINAARDDPRDTGRGPSVERPE